MMLKQSLSLVFLLTVAATWPGEAQVKRNAGKYGAMMSWWYETLPPFTKYPPTLRWDARDQRWWNGIIRQAAQAKLGWIAMACWGQNSNADPATLGPLLRAIDANGGSMKVALFDDTTSPVLRKNQEKHGTWTTTPRFDLADLEGTGEGGFKYFYDQQWKRFFATIPDKYRLKINGRPVVFMWHGGAEWYRNTTEFHVLIASLRAAAQRDFGIDPFVIVEESWRRLDPQLEPDAMYDWFDPKENVATLTEFRGVHVGQLIPGFDCPQCDPPLPVIERQGGALFRAGLDAVAPKADLVLLEGLVDVEENAHLVETTTWGRQYLDIIRWYATNIP
jgi:hypothetical protein